MQADIYHYLDTLLKKPGRRVRTPHGKRHKQAGSRGSVPDQEVFG
jgi:hypothetical protein